MSQIFGRPWMYQDLRSQIIHSDKKILEVCGSEVSILTRNEYVSVNKDSQAITQPRVLESGSILVFNGFSEEKKCSYFPNVLFLAIS